MTQPNATPDVIEQNVPHPQAQQLANNLDAIYQAGNGYSDIHAQVAIAQGAKVMADASGQAVTYVNNLSNVANGKAMTAASASGDIITVLKFLGFHEDSGT